MNTRVLIYPAGEQNAIEAVLALSPQVNVELFGCGSKDRLGPHFLSHFRSGFPSIEHPDVIEALNDLTREWQIDLILPTHDSVVEFLAIHRDELVARPMVPSARTSTICRDKEALYAIIEGLPFCPTVFHETSPEPTGPIWAKPRKGQGGIGGRRIDSIAGWRDSVDFRSEVVTEFLPGLELTVDCFSDANSALEGVFPRTRDEVLGGISVAGSALTASDEVLTIARALNDTLQFVGMWYFQLREDELGALKVMEVSARIPGGQALTRARGVNLPLMSVYAHLGIPTELFSNDVEISFRRVLTSVYSVAYEYDHVFVDLDDTLVVDGAANGDLMSLIYQWRRQGKRITLLTRHAGDPTVTLDLHGIHPGLFDGIVHLRGDEPKSIFVPSSRSVFIDNAYSERAEVHRTRGIPVYDVCDSEVLRSWTR